jgi:hypothetical protein
MKLDCLHYHSESTHREPVTGKGGHARLAGVLIRGFGGKRMSDDKSRKSSAVAARSSSDLAEFQTDPEAIPDPHRIAELFHKGLDQMEALSARRLRAA